MKDAALRLALKLAFRMGQDYWYYADHEFSSYHKKADAIRAKFDQMVEETIKQALEETPRVSPEPEPVAWGVDWGKAGDSPCVSIIKRLPGGGIEVVAVEYGLKREWAWLTKEDVDQAWGDGEVRGLSRYDIARAIEAKLKEKNT